MAKPEYFYGVHSVESLLELEPERVLTLFTLKGRDDQRLKRVLELAEPVPLSRISSRNTEGTSGRYRQIFY